MFVYFFLDKTKMLSVKMCLQSKDELNAKKQTESQIGGQKQTKSPLEGLGKTQLRAPQNTFIF